MTLPFPTLSRHTPGRLLRTFLLFLLPILILAGTGCGDDTATGPNGDPGFSGTLYYEAVGGDVARYEFGTQIESSLFEGRNPSMFPSGEFAVLGEYAQSIEIVNATGTARNEIYRSNTIYSVFEPKVSPDGTRIAFTQHPASQQIRTVVIDRSGQTIREFENLASPSWTSDGRLVMSGSWLYPYSVTSRVITPGGNSSIFMTDAALTTATAIGTALDEPLNPTPSRDGTRIAFSLNDHIWTVNIDGSGIRQITSGTKAEGMPIWSPDSRYIACICFGTYEVSYYNAIAVVPSSPSAPTDMANDAAIWPRDKNTLTGSAKGRLNGTDHITWK